MLARVVRRLRLGWLRAEVRWLLARERWARELFGGGAD